MKRLKGISEFEFSEPVKPPKFVSIKLHPDLAKPASPPRLQWKGSDLVFKIEQGTTPLVTAEINLGRALAAGNLEAAAYLSNAMASQVSDPTVANKYRAESLLYLNQLPQFQCDVPLIEEGNGIIRKSDEMTMKLAGYQRKVGLKNSQFGEVDEKTLQFLLAESPLELAGKSLLEKEIDFPRQSAALSKMDAWSAWSVPNPELIFRPNEPYTLKGYQAVISELVKEGNYRDAAWLSWTGRVRANNAGERELADQFLKEAYENAAQVVGIPADLALEPKTDKIYPSSSLAAKLKAITGGEPKRLFIGTRQFENLSTGKDFKKAILKASQKVSE